MEESFFPPCVRVPTSVEQVYVKNIVLIYNPFSGAQKGAAEAGEAIQYFNGLGVYVSAIGTEYKGHCRELCRTLSFKGVDVLCLLGGDGTVHEAIDGLMKRHDYTRMNLHLGIIPAGTGNSFALETLGDLNIHHAMSHIMRGFSISMDVAKVTFAQHVSYSFNSIHWGLASKVVLTAERLRWMRKASRYTTAALLELIKGSKQRVRVVMEDKDGNIIEHENKYSFIIANNIRGAAKGMQMAPQAKINDGLIDILLISSAAPLDLMKVWASVYNGTHISLPYVEYRQVKRFSLAPFDDVESEDEGDSIPTEEVIDIDGEIEGWTPFTCEVIPSAIKVIV